MAILFIFACFWLLTDQKQLPETSSEDERVLMAIENVNAQFQKDKQQGKILSSGKVMREIQSYHKINKHLDSKLER